MKDKKYLTKVEVEKLKVQLYHDVLPEELIARAEKLFPVIRTCSAFKDYSMEQWVNGFKSDMHPEQEIAIWEWAVKKFVDQTKGKSLPEPQIRELWETILTEMNEKQPITIGKEIPFA
jgi:hypothetical protein